MFVSQSREAMYFKGSMEDKHVWIVSLSILAYICNGGLFIEFEKLIPYSLECVLFCLPLGLYILVCFFSSFLIFQQVRLASQLMTLFHT